MIPTRLRLRCEDRIACGGPRVRVVPDAVSAPHSECGANAVRLGLGFDVVAQGIRDGSEVEVDEHYGDEDLAGGESSRASTTGGGDTLFADVFEAAVQCFDRLASVIEEFGDAGRLNAGECLVISCRVRAFRGVEFEGSAFNHLRDAPAQ